ncbi:MAG: UDP-N-acetylglucosamine diphosphorylase, partial [Clostridiales bacterium]|nr:UDP-N-acetylglucosamine diphosphorylase [Clostridiales bacterium]
QNTRIVDSTIGDHTEIQSSVVMESKIGNNATIGPFAHIRPDSNIGDNCKVGSFVEVKNSNMANGAKAPHLAYIGDADIGRDVNLACGVVFVNYNGSQKFRSVVKDGAFVGCNVNVVSPVVIEEDAYIAAGSTVTKDVPAGALCVAREREHIIKGWVAKKGILKKK